MVKLKKRFNHIFRENQGLTHQELQQPIDRVAIGMILGLTLLISILLLTGGSTAPKVRDFSWQDKQIGAEDTAFILTFNRPMNHASVERNLIIEPPLPGKVSWAGRRMAYTILQPAPYGNKYTVKLSGAKERFYGLDKGELMQPFEASFQSRDRAFVYIGFAGAEKGRLILVNLTKNQQPLFLTPENLIVMDFEFFPLGEKILFSAVEKQNELPKLIEQQIYTVTTGINYESQGDKLNPLESPGKIEKVLDNSVYQNLKFDLSDDGKIIIVQRVNRKDVSDSGPWVVELGKSPRPLTNKEGIIQKGGDFLIAPDSKTLVLLQGEGTAILSINPETNTDDLMFLPKFGRVLSFAHDGSIATMVKYNQDGTRSLYIVTNQGSEQEVLRTRPYGNILTAKFDHTKTILYCLLTQVVENAEEYEEQPYLAAFDLKKNILRPLVILPKQREVNLDLSADGLAFLFDQMVTISPTESEQEDSAENTKKSTIISRLWLLPLDSKMPEDNSQWELQPEELPLTGFNPKWAP
jgi:hypothetical protein